MTLVSGGGFFGLRQVNAQVDEQIRYYQNQREITNANHQQLKKLTQQRQDLLGGLRSGLPILVEGVEQKPAGVPGFPPGRLAGWNILALIRRQPARL